MNLEAMSNEEKRHDEKARQDFRDELLRAQKACDWKKVEKMNAIVLAAAHAARLHAVT